MRLLASVLGLASLLSASHAAAHHPAPSPVPTSDSITSRSSQALRSVARLEVEAAEFDLAYQGFWQTTSLSFQYVFLDRLAIAARLPWAHVRYSDGHDVWGPGDVEVAARVRLFSVKNGMLSALFGLGVELPSGSIKDGLGDGHVMFTPHLMLNYLPRRDLALTLSVSDHFGPQPSGHDQVASQPGHTTQHGTGHKPPATSQAPAVAPARGSVLAPHSDHEMTLQLAATYRRGALYAFVDPSLVVVWDSDGPAGPMTMSGGIGVMPRPALRVELRVDAPLSGQRRRNWHSGLGVEYSF